MKRLRIIACIVASFTPIYCTLAADSVAVEGKVIETTKKAGIGAFTVKAYPTENPDTSSASVSRDSKPLAQTLTLADGTYSLTISAGVKAVILQFEKLSYFSVPSQQVVTFTPPKTTVPDVAAVKYGYGQIVSTHDVLDAFKIREASFNAMAANLLPSERKKFIESDIDSLKNAGVDSQTISAVKAQFLPP
jgi:hypothetical protein